MKVRWTAAAASDLVSITEFISRDSAAYAAAVAGVLRARAAALGRFPARGRVVPEMDNPDIRELLIGNYRLVYRRNSATIEVVAVIHGARYRVAALARRSI